MLIPLLGLFFSSVCLFICPVCWLDFFLVTSVCKCAATTVTAQRHRLKNVPSVWDDSGICRALLTVSFSDLLF